MVLLAVMACWWSQTRGLISSNDGSHVALGRALVRGRTDLGTDVGLTLWVDLASVAGKTYSDRPPGTAFAALPALWLARPLDARFEAWSRQRRETAPAAPVADALVIQPASWRYIETYGARRQRTRDASVDLLALQGTALLVGLHVVVVGALGLALVWWTLARRRASASACAFAVVMLGLGSLYGPYCTALFSHVSSAVALMLAWRAREHLGEPHRNKAAAISMGVALGWAVATDYALVLVALGMLALACRVRDWPWIALGSVPVAVAVAAYHHAAFGAWWRIGYDFHATFAFARARVSTFSGEPLVGLWTLWGAGGGAGVLVQAPVMLFGLVGLWRSDLRRLALAFVPWLVLLMFHRTPAGGAGEDHRYLVPVMPVLACGLGLLWDRLGAWSKGRATATRIALGGVGLVSIALTWQHFWSWRGA